MNKILAILSAKKPYYYVLLGSVVLSAVAFILYLAFGRTQFDPHYSPWLIAAWAVGIACGIFSLVKTLRPVLFAVCLLAMAALIYFFVSQLNYIANVFTAIDAQSFTGSFYATAVFSILALAAAVTAFNLSRRKEVSA